MSFSLGNCTAALDIHVAQCQRAAQSVCTQLQLWHYQQITNCTLAPTSPHSGINLTLQVRKKQSTFTYEQNRASHTWIIAFSPTPWFYSPSFQIWNIMFLDSRFINLILPLQLQIYCILPKNLLSKIYESIPYYQCVWNKTSVSPTTTWDQFLLKPTSGHESVIIFRHE